MSDWIGIAAAVVGAYAQSAADEARQYEDAESCIPTLQRGSHGTSPCGWECTGCKATNAAHDERCSWCRSYRVAPAVVDDNNASRVQLMRLQNKHQAAILRQLERREVKP